jgi:hypothetical protein
LRGQQTKSAVTVNAVTSHVQNVQKDTPDDPDAEEGAEHEANPAVVLQPSWLFSTDSDANVRNPLKLESSIAAGSHNRIGLLVGESLISNSMSGSNTEDTRDTGLTGQWRPSDVLKFDGMAGVSITNAGCDIACKTDTVGKRGALGHYLASCLFVDWTLPASIPEHIV